MYVKIAIVKHLKKVSKNAEMNASYMAKDFAKKGGIKYDNRRKGRCLCRAS